MELDIEDEESNMTAGVSEEDIFKYKQSSSCLNTTGDDHIVIDIRTRQENKYYGNKGLQPKCSIKSDEVSRSDYYYYKTRSMTSDQTMQSSQHTSACET